MQTDFSAARGNALQACFASIFALALAEVPNFLKAAQAAGTNYLEAIDVWLAPRSLGFLKVALSIDSGARGNGGDQDRSGDQVPGGARHTAGAGRLEFPTGPALCALAGPSPRGDFKHAVVARVKAGQVTVSQNAGARAQKMGIGTVFEIAHAPHPDGPGPPLWAGFFFVARHDG
ncbi:MAG: hypothetical protein RIF32_16385 [Leptospirales bacterium]